MANRDKARYELEMKDYTPPPGATRGKRGAKKFKDPNAPKRPLSGYFMFMAEQRPKVVAANTALKLGDVAKECGRLWQEASNDVKSKYYKLADADKDRYAKVTFSGFLF